MTILELADLVKEMEEKFGVSAAAPVPWSAAALRRLLRKSKEKTEFDVVLKEAGAEEAERHQGRPRSSSSGLGLKEAKDLVDNAPQSTLGEAPAEGSRRRDEEEARRSRRAVVEIK